MNMNDVQQDIDACPSTNELRAFSTGRLPQPALDLVTEHIEAHCPQCVAALDKLEERADALLADLREPPPISAAEAAEVCQGVLEHVLGPAVSTLDWHPPWSPSAATALDEAPPDLRGHKIRVPPIGERDGWPKMGGMGVVWRVLDLQFQRSLALKVMKAESANSRRVCRFLSEARITAQLAHPSIVPVHAVGWLDDGRPYYTMKLVEGKTLAEILKAEPDVASRRTELLQVFARVCQALAFAHRKGVIHRDLKPSNVMVGEHGEVHVMDWGLAKSLAKRDVLPAEAAQTNGSLDESDGRTRDGERLGTSPYMPPEQANGKIEEVDRRSDVFGLGAILCEILTGRQPYVGPKADVMRQACNAELEDAYARLKTCGADAELIALARDCLLREPNDRPEDASVVEKRLTGYRASVQERLRQTELDRAAAQARAEEAERTRRLAEEKAEAEGRLRRLAEEKAEGERRERELAEGKAKAEQGRLAAEEARQAEKRQNAIDKALTAAMGGDLQAAQQATAEAERAGASTGQVQLLRGQIALHSGKSREARQYLKEAVRLLPGSAAARGMLAVAYASDGHWDRYDWMIREMARFTPSTPEDFLFMGCAEALLDPKLGLQTIQQAFDRRPMMGIALLLRAEVRTLVARDTDDLKEAEGAVQDANYAKELLRDNPAALWVSLSAHLAKASVHDHRKEPDQRRAELELAGKNASTLERFPALPEAVVYRWLYFREMGREEEVLGELRQASNETDHAYVNFWYALTLYRRGQRGDFEEALRVLENRPGTHNALLLPFLLAEHDYPDKHDWPARARKALEDFTASSQDAAAVMNAQAVLCLLGNKEDVVKASQKLQKEPGRFYTLRREPILRCLRYNAGELSADDLIQGAQGSRWDLCMAHFFVAMTKLAEGDRKGAQEHFDEAVKTRAFIWGTYEMSWVFQARLAKDPTWPPWIPAGRAK
jgi:hypothetical protein